jgi:hypothetical protein
LEDGQDDYNRSSAIGGDYWFDVGHADLSVEWMAAGYC